MTLHSKPNTSLIDFLFLKEVLSPPTKVLLAGVNITAEHINRLVFWGWKGLFFTSLQKVVIYLILVFFFCWSLFFLLYENISVVIFYKNSQLHSGVPPRSVTCKLWSLLNYAIIKILMSVIFLIPSCSCKEVILTAINILEHEYIDTQNPKTVQKYFPI